MKILVTGASGNIGLATVHLATFHHTTYAGYLNHPPKNILQCVRIDLTNLDSTQRAIQLIHPDCIVHTAVSERTPHMAKLIPLSASNIAIAAREINARLIALSTDLVFDGRGSPYSESSAPIPISQYGKSKALSEKIIAQQCPDSLIVRTSLVYDFNSENHQFRWMLSRIRNRQKIELFDDEIRQPIWVWNLASILIKLANTGITGILHVAGPHSLSRWQLGCDLLFHCGIIPQPITLRTHASSTGLQRPPDCTLSTARLQHLLRVPLLTIREAAQHKARANLFLQQ